LWRRPVGDDGRRPRRRAEAAIVVEEGAMIPCWRSLCLGGMLYLSGPRLRVNIGEERLLTWLVQGGYVYATPYRIRIGIISLISTSIHLFIHVYILERIPSFYPLIVQLSVMTRNIPVNKSCTRMSHITNFEPTFTPFKHFAHNDRQYQHLRSMWCDNNV
jgi:hypothetical protein